MTVMRFHGQVLGMGCPVVVSISQIDLESIKSLAHEPVEEEEEEDTLGSSEFGGKLWRQLLVKIRDVGFEMIKTEVRAAAEAKDDEKDNKFPKLKATLNRTFQQSSYRVQVAVSNAKDNTYIVDGLELVPYKVHARIELIVP